MIFNQAKLIFIAVIVVILFVAQVCHDTECDECPDTSTEIIETFITDTVFVGTGVTDTVFIDIAHPTIVIQLTELDNGSAYTIVDIIRGAVAGDDGDGGQGNVFFNATNPIAFGSWVNAQCGTSGDGWYVQGVGSCSEGGGSLIKRLQWVEVEVINR